jgi:tetratricopeptide (TPR) repeat protein
MPPATNREQIAMNLRLFAVPALAVACALPALAATTNDEIAAKLKARDVQAADKLARERIAQNPQDEAAYNFVAAAALQGDPKMREAAMPTLEACIEKNPKSAICHHRLGQVYGMTAMSGGMMAILKYAPRIKDLFLRAVELDPSSFDARRDLIQYYLQAPGIAGGSVASAKDNAEAHAKVNSAQGKLLMADVHLYKKEYDLAEQVLASLPPPSDDRMRITYRAYQTSLGFSLIDGGQHARAQKLFETLISANAEHAQSHFGLGRALLEASQIDSAIVALEKAVQLDPALGAQYRLGIAYQAKGDRSKAASNLQQFLDAKPPRTGKAADDARRRLEELKKAA